MRILILHNRYRPIAPSGENAVVDQETAALREAGHQVHLVQRHSADIEDWSLARRATLPAQVVWSESSRRLVEREIVAFAPDVVHVHNTFPLLTPSVLSACRRAGVPVVATLHNYKLTCANGELFRDGSVCHDCLGGSALPALRHGCYRSSRAATAAIVAAQGLNARAWRESVSAYMFISAAQRDLLAPLGFPAERCFVRHNYVADPLDGLSPPDPETAPPVVAFVGRLDEAKGAPLLMAAWDRFRTERSDRTENPDGGLRLVVAGGGPLADVVQRWAGERDEVEFAGLVPRERVGQILGGARAAVVPSAWEETFGLVAVEAMASGTAPIVAGHGALPELLTPGRDGQVFTPGDARSLAAVLADVEDRPEPWTLMGRRARETYLRGFTQTVGIETLLAVYEYAIAHPIEWSAPEPVSPRPQAGLLPR